MIKVGVNGAKGRMGSCSVSAIKADSELELVFQTDRGDNLSKQILESSAEVVLDFTLASTGFQNAKTIIESGARPIVGTSGFQIEQVEELSQLCKGKSLGGIVVPNFSISAVLMMKFARDAAKHFDDVEIIEYNHEKKEDSPSWTAIKSAEIVREAKGKDFPKRPDKPILPGARGAELGGIRLHSVRSPGVSADQEILFASSGETLKLASYTISRECYMPGVKLACKKVLGLNSMEFGLEALLD